jgi:hypothetical protein
MANFNEDTIMEGIERIHFFQDRPQSIGETSELCAEKITSKDLDIDKFMAPRDFIKDKSSKSRF